MNRAAANLHARLSSSSGEITIEPVDLETFIDDVGLVVSSTDDEYVEGVETDHVAENVALAPMGGRYVTRHGRLMIASRRAFARHFLEMVVAMLLGMGVLEGVAALAFAAAGSGLTDQPGAFRVMLMGLNMTVPMVMWMRYRGHSASRNGEMAASMLVPSGVAAALAAAGVLGVGAALLVQHAVMIPAMLAVMLWRYDEYARPHAASSRVQ
jgi:hypothetical protein